MEATEKPSSKSLFSSYTLHVEDVSEFNFKISGFYKSDTELSNCDYTIFGIVLPLKVTEGPPTWDMARGWSGTRSGPH